MFDYDKWQEILLTIRKNKLRTALTMFGVFWGILILILLLGSGEGLINGFKGEYSWMRGNAGFLWTEITSIPYEGMQRGRRIQLRNEDTEAIRQSVHELEYVSPRIFTGGMNGENIVSRKSNTGAFNIYGDYPSFSYVRNMNIVKGRFINDLDIRDKRKVAVIAEQVVNVLFKKNEKIIGEYIIIHGINFKVVGLTKNTARYDSLYANRDMNSIYLPFTTFQKAFNYGNRVGWYGLTFKPGNDANEGSDKIKKLLMKRHKIHPDDISAFGSWNTQEDYRKVISLFKGTRLFVWMVGICTFMAGLIGVSNIMLIIVNDRIKEIGIRKSLGATSKSIISSIIQESVFITALAGYFGLFLGIILIEGIGFVMQKMTVKIGAFTNPEVNFHVIIFALVIIVLGGALAGLLPAKRAVSISPMEAIRYN